MPFTWNSVYLPKRLLKSSQHRHICQPKPLLFKFQWTKNNCIDSEISHLSINLIE